MQLKFSNFNKAVQQRTFLIHRDDIFFFRSEAGSTLICLYVCGKINLR